MGLRGLRLGNILPGSLSSSISIAWSGNMYFIRPYALDVALTSRSRVLPRWPN